MNGGMHRRLQTLTRVGARPTTTAAERRTPGKGFQ